MEKENRYTTRYPYRESPLENLRMIREKGMEAGTKELDLSFMRKSLLSASQGLCQMRG